MNQEEIRQLLQDVREIKRALTGDTKWGEPGLIKDVAALKGWKDSLSLRIAYYSGGATVVVIALSKAFDYFTTAHK